MDPRSEREPKSPARPVHPDLDGLTRELGLRDDGRPGPLVILVAGMHGNEPAGVRALRALFAELEETPTGGRIVGIVGNVSALRLGLRHQGQDLNRLWLDDELRALAARAPADDTPDEAELRAVFSLIEAERDAARAQARRVVLVDLHSTSADGGAFSVVPDSIPSRRLARDIGLPAVLGLEERIEGPLMTWLVAQGETAVVVEGGQHELPSTPEVMLASLWVVLDHVGVLPEGDERVGRARMQLSDAAGDAPRVLDLVYAHPVRPDDSFVMAPGWRNFQPVDRDELMATDAAGEVRSPVNGYMLMPLYQGLGTEGFFLCRRVTARWLFLSRVVRHTWLEQLLRLLPGIRSLDTKAGRVVAKRRSSHWLVRVLHLFGYRKNAPTGEWTVWTRRPQ